MSISPHSGLGPRLLILAAAAWLVAGCEEGSSGPPAAGAPGVRATPHSTVAGALAALEQGDYASFPALVGLALTLKAPAARGTAGEPALLKPSDFEPLRAILTAAQDAKPRLSDGGKLAIYRLPGHGLTRDELHLVRLREKWYFIVD